MKELHIPTAIAQIKSHRYHGGGALDKNFFLEAIYLTFIKNSVCTDELQALCGYVAIVVLRYEGIQECYPGITFVFSRAVDKVDPSGILILNMTRLKAKSEFDEADHLWFEATFYNLK